MSATDALLKIEVYACAYLRLRAGAIPRVVVVPAASTLVRNVTHMMSADTSISSGLDPIHPSEPCRGGRGASIVPEGVRGRRKSEQSDRFAV